MDLDQLSKIQQETQIRICNEGLSALKTSLKELFDSHPTLEGIKWIQWTPYFNDGDPCVFSIQNFYVKDSTIIEPQDACSYDWKSDGFFNFDSNYTESLNKDLVSALEKFHNNLCILEYWLQQQFSESEITAYRDKDELEINTDVNHD